MDKPQLVAAGDPGGHVSAQEIADHFTAEQLTDEIVEWLTARLHPGGLRCPRCHSAATETQIKALQHGRQAVCSQCKKWYRFNSANVFAGGHFTLKQLYMVGLLIGLDLDNRTIAARLNIHHESVANYRRRFANRNSRYLSNPHTPRKSARSKSNGHY